MTKKLFFFSCAMVFFAGCGTKAPTVDLYNPEPVPKPQPKISEFPRAADTPAVPTSTIPSSALTTTTMNTESPKTITYVATLHTTVGDIEITLNNDQTPKTVENFVTLAKKNFYNNTIFHRVIKGFMIQGGDPKGDGTGNPGYRFDDEPFTGEYTRGTVAMANSGPNTNGSQFFIMHANHTFRSNDYVIFGHVTKGMEVVDAIATAPVQASSHGEKSSPIDPVKVKSVTVVEK